MEAWRNRSRRATVVLVIGSVVLIGPALAGVGATLPLAGLLGVLTVVLWAGREYLEQLPTVLGYDLGVYARDSWIGVVLGVAIVLGTLGTPPVELQAFGGFVGLTGIVNYFLRPLYLFVAEYVGRLGRKRQ